MKALLMLAGVIGMAIVVASIVSLALVGAVFLIIIYGK